VSPGGAAVLRAALERRLQSLLVESCRLHGLEPGAISAEEPLFGGRLGLDSVDALELVVALEREFGIAIATEEVGREDFANLRALAEFVTARLSLREGGSHA